MTPPPIPFSLVGLWLYPVKSLAGAAVQEARPNAWGGLAGDREWAIVNAAGEVTWQGALPRLALVQPVLTRATLTLHFPGCFPLTVPLGAPRAGCSVQIWNDGQKVNEVFPAEDAGDGAAAWLTGTLGQPLRLVRLGPEAQGREGVQRLHVLSTGSLQALNGELQAHGHPEAEVERFRPNLLIEAAGPDTLPFLEERAATLTWTGGMQVRLGQPCVRCVMPNIDLHDARVGREPLATLVRMSTRRHPGEPVRFGVYGHAVTGDHLEVGQTGQAERPPAQGSGACVQ
ncbi:MOSC domain-containing protein [Deinococcus hopiensis]|uniref:MOSC domain-containing protein n=1 Tax=Deinococcus hopiensis KR-140 TaxID=695939 RepID=A0A1W1VN64_9DEIO|nr:MOSC N-terminal beta barrel domain-containing protein [Deinococcus hopiensis]SMB94394.1 hypothetical protein SAMN00790413_02368 [Deinococcus hopiensis KR-140]